MPKSGRFILAALEVRQLAAGYGRARVLFDLDLQVARGEVAVLFGRNGAGKSTTLKAIMGLLRPQGGEIFFDGRNLAGLAPFEIARLGLGYVAEDRRLFTGLTVAENLEVGRRPGGRSTAEVLALFPQLKAMLDRPAGRMSGGEQQMLAIA